MNYYRNPDVDIRKLERALAQNSDDLALALALYRARKRSGDEWAGSKWYDWLIDRFLVNFDITAGLKMLR